MCKVNCFLLSFVVIFCFGLAFFWTPALAEEPNVENATPSTSAPPIDIQSLQPLQGMPGNVPIINPYTNEIIDPSSYQPKEKTWWEKIYPYALDVAIGVGAALVMFAVIKLVQMKKREKNNSAQGGSARG